MKSSLTTRNKIIAAGMKVRTKNEDEANMDTAKIYPMWDSFFKQGVQKEIPDQVNGNLLGIYTDYESDHNGMYTSMVAVEVSGTDKLPGELHSIEIPEQKYLHYELDVNPEKMMEDIHAAWREIWDYFDNTDEHQRAYVTDFEVYDFANPGKVDIFIGIK